MGKFGKVSIGRFPRFQKKLIKGAILKVYEGAPHGLCTTLKDRINADLLEFIEAGAGKHRPY